MKKSMLLTCVALAGVALADETVDDRVRTLVDPVRVVWTTESSDAGKVTDPDSLLLPKRGQIPEGGFGLAYRTCRLINGGRPPGVVLDFGREIHGGLRIGFASAPGRHRVRIRFGESVAEAMAELGERGCSNAHAIRDTVVEAPSMGVREIGNTGFRFVRIDLADAGKVGLEFVQAVSLMRPMRRLGAFRSSDERLNRIWETAVRTVHLCCQEYLWDGIKRDRLVWMGDTHPETMSLLSVFGDGAAVLPKSLDYMAAVTPTNQWMNNMGSYTLWWVRNLAEWYRFTGDVRYLEKHRDYLSKTVRKLVAHVTPSNTFDGIRRPFLDWPSEHNRPAVTAGLQGLAVTTFEEAAVLAEALRDGALAETCRAAARRLAAQPRLAPCGSKQAAAMLALSGLRSPQEMFAEALGRNGHAGVSTFYGYYMLEAMSAAGENRRALDTVRDYWGAMLDVGATSFWENFDLAWTNNCFGIDAVPVPGKKDVHGDYGEFCYKGFRHSLCHGWSSGPAAWCIRHVLGIRPLTPGCGKVEVRPFLGDLVWAEGAMALPRGRSVRVRAEKRPDGTVRTVVEAPDDVEIMGDVERIGQPSRKTPTVVTVLDGCVGWTVDGEPVTVPHTWNAIDAADGEDVPPDWLQKGYSSGASSYLRKVVTYRRNLPDAKPGRRYFIRCGGASVKTTVRVNGKEVGRHVGSFTGFCFEVTEAMKSAGNMLEMTVDSRFDPDVQPIHADFSVYGGLHCVPELIETGTVCIDRRRHPVVTADPDTGHVRVEVPVSGAADQTQEFDFPSRELWSPEHPHLYPVTLKVADDVLTVNVGFRKTEFREDGFYLNGVKRKLRGVCRHQDREGKGWGATPEDEAEDVRWIKRMGADAVRTAHYPHSEAFYDLCDREGLLVWTELPNVNILTFTDAAERNERMMAREMVEQHRNHPSIFAWGIFNELYAVKMNGPAEPRMRALRAYIEEMDPTRTVVAASDKRWRTELNAIPAQLGFNLYPGWYGGGSTNMADVINSAFASNPVHRILAVSEYGGGAAVSHHADVKFRPMYNAKFHPEEYQAYHHWGNYSCIARDPRLWGSFLWVMFDLGSDAKREGERSGLNDKGLVTWDRSTPKDAYWFYKANWNPEPLLHLVGTRMTSTTNAVATVMAVSNVGAVTLKVNGKTVGTRMPDDVRTVFWDDVPLACGVNEIEVRAGNFRKIARWTRK